MGSRGGGGGLSAGAGAPAATPADGRWVLPDAVRISSRSRGLLSALKSRTGLPQHASARIALCLSLADRSEEPDAGAYDEEGSEIRVSDVFCDGCRDAYQALLAYAMRGAGSNDAGSFLRAHVNRGITMLFSRVRALEDVGSLMPPARDEKTKGDTGAV